MSSTSGSIIQKTGIKGVLDLKFDVFEEIRGNIWTTYTKSDFESTIFWRKLISIMINFRSVTIMFFVDFTAIINLPIGYLCLR